MSHLSAACCVVIARHILEGTLQPVKTASSHIPGPVQQAFEDMTYAQALRFCAWQAWIAAIADKLDSSLSEVSESAAV